MDHLVVELLHHEDEFDTLKYEFYGPFVDGITLSYDHEFGASKYKFYAPIIASYGDEFCASKYIHFMLQLLHHMGINLTHSNVNFMVKLLHAMVRNSMHLSLSCFRYFLSRVFFIIFNIFCRFFLFIVSYNSIHLILAHPFFYVEYCFTLNINY